MTAQLTFDELAALMKSGAGVTVDPRHMESHADSTFAEYGLDSLGLLGIVGALENDRGCPMPQDAELCKTPQDFVDLVNTALKAGA